MEKESKISPDFIGDNSDEMELGTICPKEIKPLDEKRKYLLKSLMAEQKFEKDGLSIEYILMRYEMEAKELIKNFLEEIKKKSGDVLFGEGHKDLEIKEVINNSAIKHFGKRFLKW